MCVLGGRGGVESDESVCAFRGGWVRVTRACVCGGIGIAAQKWGRSECKCQVEVGAFCRQALFWV